MPDEVRATDIDETPQPRELPRDCAARLALAKARSVATDANAIILAADTVVGLGRRILGKPQDAGEAEAFLTLLSGRRHAVYSSVVVRRGATERQRTVRTIVRFRPVDRSEVRRFVDSEEWRGKAGGYGIQGQAAAFIPWISGSYSCVVGLPLVETAALLRSFGHG